MTIYEIRSEIDRLIEEAVDPETGVLAEDYIDKLNALQMSEREKEINCALAYKNRMANVDAINVEIEKLKKKQKMQIEQIKADFDPDSELMELKQSLNRKKKELLQANEDELDEIKESHRREVIRLQKRNSTEIDEEKLKQLQNGFESKKQENRARRYS